MALCECGCGCDVKKGNRFVHGHNARSEHPMQGRKHSDESRCKMRESHDPNQIGEGHPMFGKKQSDESRRKMSASHKGVPLSEKHCKSIGETSKRAWGRKTQEERDAWAKAISEGEKGKPPMNPEALKRMAATKKGKRYSPHTEFTSELLKSRYQDPAYIQKMAAAWNIKPNKAEVRMLNLLNELFPDEWEYVGDFSFTLGGKCPDFVHRDKKLIVEYFGDYWHRGHNADDRVQAFEPFGYKTLVIWGSEMGNMANVIDKINVFAGQA